MALAGVACGLEIDGDVTISNTAGEGITQVTTGTGLDIDYATYHNQIITTQDPNVSLYAIYYKENTLGTENATLTLNVAGTLDASSTVCLGTHASYKATVNTSITTDELTTLENTGSVARWVVTTDRVVNFATNKVALTLNGISGYTDGGVILEMDGYYYSFEDASISSNGYVTLKSTASAIDFSNAKKDTLYTTFKITAAGTSASVKGIGFLIVPEPATATLSLLALTGLAARRRRK